MTEFYASWGLEEMGVFQHALEALLTSLRIEYALAAPDERLEIDQYGKKVRYVRDCLAETLAKKNQACPVCRGLRWLGAADIDKPFSSWRRLECTACLNRIGRHENDPL